MLGNWKNTLDKGGFVCAMFMDLSKVFDAMNGDLLIAELAYGFQKRCNFFHGKLFNEKTATSYVNSKFITWGRIISGVPQGSMLGPLLCNVLNDLFLFVESSEVSNYADISTLYNSGNNLGEVQQTLREGF